METVRGCGMCGGVPGGRGGTPRDGPCVCVCGGGLPGVILWRRRVGVLGLGVCVRDPEAEARQILAASFAASTLPSAARAGLAREILAQDTFPGANHLAWAAHREMVERRTPPATQGWRPRAGCGRCNYVAAQPLCTFECRLEGGGRALTARVQGSRAGASEERLRETEFGCGSGDERRKGRSRRGRNWERGRAATNAMESASAFGGST